MKILFSQYALAQRGGSELFVMEVAGELLRRGHSVAVYTGTAGPMAAGLPQLGGVIVGDPRKCPWTPDVIHGQHRMFALKALMAFPSTPAIHYIHGFLPRVEKPFRHPRILRYVTISHGMAKHFAASLGLPPERFEVIHNHIDLERYDEVRTVSEKPRKALVYSHATFSPMQLSVIGEACRERGISLELAGLCNGRVEEHPERLLPNFDLVFAIGRSALEAAACGCGVIPLYGGMVEELLHPDNYSRIRSQNFAVRLSLHEKLSAEWIGRQVDQWDRDAIRSVTRMVREEARLEKTVDRLESIYREVIAAYACSGQAALDDELLALENILRKEDRDDLRLRNEHLSRGKANMQRRIHDLHGSWSWKITAPLRGLQGLFSTATRKRGERLM